MYFHTKNEQTINYIAAVVETAAEHGQTLRIAVGGDGSLRIKRGEGMWSGPVNSDPDPYRDGDK